MSYQSHTPESVVHFEKIGQIAISVTDLRRARDFYGKTLGMRYLFDAPQMTFFQCGEIRLVIGTGEPGAARGGTILYFKVEEITAVYERLSGEGVEFLHPPQLVAKLPDHNLWMTFLKDPDGNVLGVMSEVARSE